MKKFWIKKVVKIIVLVIAGVFLLSAIVMGLWNAILPVVLGVKTITFFQAMGILVLSKILFSGFKGKGGGPRGEWREKMREKWGNMTPEQQERFRAEWKNRCGKWGHWSQKETKNEQQQ